MKDTLLELYKMEDDELHEYVISELESNGYIVTNSPKEYVYAVTDELNPIMMVAHMDTVHKDKPTDKTLQLKNDVIGSLSTGLGADDRNGIYAILELVKRGFRPQVLFTHGEEIGGLGAKAFTLDFKEPIIKTKFMIELDRKGINECVFYDCGNKKFQSMVQSYGFIKHIGSYSDIDTISKAWDIASVNLSVGYYNAHRNNEYTLFSGIEFTINRVSQILSDESKLKYYEYEEVKYNYSYKNYNYNYTYENKDGHKIGDKVKYIGEDKENLVCGETYTITKSYLVGCYVGIDNNRDCWVSNVDLFPIEIPKETELEKEIKKVRKELEDYNYSSTLNGEVAKALSKEFKVEYDKFLKTWFLEVKEDEN